MSRVLPIVGCVLGFAAFADAQTPVARPANPSQRSGAAVAYPPAIPQAPQPPRGVAPPDSPPAPARLGAPALTSTSANIRLDLTITDNLSGAEAKKTVSMLIVSGSNGMIRTSNTVPILEPASSRSEDLSARGLLSPDKAQPRVVAYANLQLNVDAVAQVYPNGIVSVHATFNYRPAPNAASVREPASLDETLNVLLHDGQRMVVSQSADPATDRRVTAELTATVLK